MQNVQNFRICPGTSVHGVTRITYIRKTAVPVRYRNTIVPTHQSVLHCYCSFKSRAQQSG
jgi:hypothetical protein